MSAPEPRQAVRTLLDQYGRTYSEELGIRVESGTPSALFRWLCASILFSARISGAIATEAARALARQGWTTARRLADSTWEQRARTLNQAGYARYDERTATMLGQTAELALEKYRGDLRRLREAAEREPRQERELLKQFKGLGDVGVDIFFREAQGAWTELFPFADRRSLQAARKLKLGKDARDLAQLVSRREFPRLVAALVRVGLARKEGSVLERAGRDR